MSYSSVKCKRYRGAISRGQVSDCENRAFKSADKGILITTGCFSANALKEAQTGGKRQLELIDGEKLVEMLKRTKLGLRKITVFDADREYYKQFEE